ncbi:MAG: IS21-like element helper ATPase IstB [Syntrophales bacterium]|nr:IS21-like element helper ATPase IstB [Syntrophales bacterium]
MKSDDDSGNQIVALAKALKLPAFADYKAYVKDSSSTEEVLYNLLAAEHSIKEQNKYNYRIKNAAFPIPKTLDTFVFDEKRLPELKKETVMELARCDFIEKRQNVVAVGNSGTGKSHIVTALGMEAIAKGYTVKFRRASELVAQMTEAMTEKHLSKFIKQVNACNVLIVDELGYLSFDTAGASLLFQIFAARYETKSTVVTSNLEFSKWVTFLGNDEHMTAALIGRLIHHSIILNMNGEDYRLQNRINK